MERAPCGAKAHPEVEVLNGSVDDRLEGAKIPVNSLKVAVLPPRLLDGTIFVDSGIRLGTRDGVEALIVENTLLLERLEDGELLISEHTKDGDRWSDEVPPCLLEFVRLNTDKAEDILAFAQRWGLMGICPHGKPADHNPDCEPLQEDKPSERVRVYWEPLDDWRRLARQVRTILEVMSDMTLNTERVGKSQDWKTIVECARPAWAAGFDDSSSLRAQGVYGPNESWHLTTLEWEESHLTALGQCIENWLLYGGVGLSAYVERERPFGLLRLEPSVHNLAGVLALQLANAATSRVGIYRCDDPKCRKPYKPLSRRPREGESHFCPACSEGRLGLAAKRQWYRNNYKPKGKKTPKRRRKGGSNG